MPTQQPSPAFDLAERAAEVRRARSRWEAEHPGLILALSVRCSQHSVPEGELCYAPMVGGVCGQRYERATQTAKSRRGQIKTGGAR